MNDIYVKALKAYIEILSIHISSKSKDNLFHKETENFYEILFDIAHDLWEKEVDLWKNIREDTLQ